MMLRLAKRLGLNAAAAVPFPAASRRLLRHRGIIFMLHRFRDPERGVDGHDPANLRRSLDYLRRHRYEIVALQDLLHRLAGEAPEPRGAIAFTIDDGYLDQATVAAPVFAEFDCPVTTFVATGFLDGNMWYWWDRVAFTFEHTPRRQLRVPVGSEVMACEWSTSPERQRAMHDFVRRCKTVADTDKERAILELARAADVALPSTAPPQYAPMSWEDARRCEVGGMSFAPHTVTHPVLVRTTDQQSAWEISESWRKVQAETAAPVPVFCYPNGQEGDFGPREYRNIAEAGMTGAVVGTPGYAEGARLRTAAEDRFRVRRFELPDDIPTMAQYASGLQRLKQMMLRSA